MRPGFRKALGLSWLWFGATALSAATLTVQTNRLGSTPDILGYNSGHFFTGSNTRDWWRYSGVNGARVFMSPSEIEPSDDVAPVGDGVTNSTSFLERRAAMRTNQFNSSFINWGSFSNRYESNDLYPNNHILPNYTIGELRKLGVRVCAQITASQSRLPIAGTNDWPNMWELWQHYYAQAFYLARVFDVDRYQMYNEPNHPNANGLTITNHLLRLQLVSDAIQLAVADVNALYGKSLTPKLLAPVTAGSADSSYPGWGESVVTNRHRTFLGQVDPAFSLIQVYDYHQYGSAPSGFGGDLANLNGFLTADMTPEPRYPTAISEFNTRTGADYDSMIETLDTPGEYARFGSIVVNLLANGCRELYCFKFSQTSATGNYPVQKNAMHFVDNTNAPYQVGGITRGGEVWRLVNKAFTAGRDRLNVIKGTGATSLDVQASYDPIARRFYLFSVNNTAAPVSLDLDLTALGVAPGNKVLLEEVSETTYGAGRLWTGLPANRIISATQNSNTVWLLTVCSNTPQTEVTVTAAEDADVRDGVNKAVNFGTSSTLTARNDPVDPANRSVAFVKFQLPTNTLARLELAVLSLQAASATLNTAAQAHVYGLSNNSWSAATLTWNNAPNLRDNVPAGPKIANGFVEGQGTNLFILGQVVATSTNAGEKLLDVTDYLRRQTNAFVSFLISQDPRWDVTLPSLAPGDTQPDGVKILSLESGNGPRLQLVFNQAANLAPSALNDTAATTQDVAVVINVLTNDSDPDGGTLSIQSFSQGANGSVSNNGNGTLTFTPKPGFSGLDNFTYTISDGQGGTGSATVNVTVAPAGGSSAQVWTNLPARAEAFVRGGANAAIDQDEIATGYIIVKYNPSPFDTARKAYFQFDLAGLNLNLNTQAVFTVITHTQTFQHRAQLWGLNQAYPAFSANVTWNNAQANDTASNDLLLTGPFTAATIGSSVLIPNTASTPRSFTLPRLGDFVLGNRVTLVLAGVVDALDDAGGLRLARTNAALSVLVTPPAPTPPIIEGITNNGDNTITVRFLGGPGETYRVLAATNLAAGGWVSLSTNLAGPDGRWSFTDGVTNQSMRFFRAVAP